MTSDTQQEPQQPEAGSEANQPDIMQPLRIGVCTVPHMGKDVKYYSVFTGEVEDAALNRAVKAITGVVDAGDDAESLRYARMFCQAPELLAAGATLAFALRCVCSSAGIDLNGTKMSMAQQPEHAMSIADALDHFDQVFRRAHGMPQPAPAEESAEEPTAGEMHDDTIIH